MLDAVILASIVATAFLLWSPKLHGSKEWRATITPLASIIGSGFLVLGPVLQDEYGALAPLVMASLCTAAWLFGWAIRYNILVRADGGERSRGARRAEHLGSAILGFAYAISVAYYLNLFGAFAVSLSSQSDPLTARLVTTAVFTIILGIGWTHGFRALENMEYVSVTLKLSIIAGLLVALGHHFVAKAGSGELYFSPPALNGWQSVALAFGLIVTVQGFETSRYLGDSYEPRTRIRSMRLSQMIATGIYMLYILLMAYVFRPGQVALSETAIIDIMRIVAPILPLMLVAAALAAQFSAAVADTAGGGGLVVEITGRRLSERQAYAVLVAIGLVLTWAANVFEIISYASRAFAAYYAVQSAIAAMNARNRSGASWRVPAFGLLFLFGVLIVVFGAPVKA